LAEHAPLALAGIFWSENTVSFMSKLLKQCREPTEWLGGALPWAGRPARYGKRRGNRV
jgi:hypothetical protein